jgi:hypothetical protein
MAVGGKGNNSVWAGKGKGGKGGKGQVGKGGKGRSPENPSPKIALELADLASLHRMVEFEGEVRAVVMGNPDLANFKNEVGNQPAYHGLGLVALLCTHNNWVATQWGYHAKGTHVEVRKQTSKQGGAPEYISNQPRIDLLTYTNQVVRAVMEVLKSPVPPRTTMTTRLPPGPHVYCFTVPGTGRCKVGSVTIAPDTKAACATHPHCLLDSYKRKGKRAVPEGMSADYDVATVALELIVPGTVVDEKAIHKELRAKEKRYGFLPSGSTEYFDVKLMPDIIELMNAVVSPGQPVPLPSESTTPAAKSPESPAQQPVSKDDAPAAEAWIC